MPQIRADWRAIYHDQEEPLEMESKDFFQMAYILLTDYEQSSVSRRITRDQERLKKKLEQEIDEEEYPLLPNTDD